MADCCLKLKELMSSLTAKEQQIASFIVDFPEEVVNMSINELADSCDASISSVVRLCKSAGYSGYKDLCRMLSVDLLTGQQAMVTYDDVRPGDSVETILKSVFLSEIRAIENTMSLLDISDLEQVVDLIFAAPRVDFYGIGTSGLVARDAHIKFLRLNKFSHASCDPHDQILYAISLKPGDVAVLLSYSGNTKDILETANVIKQTGATIVSITRFSKNPLSQMADISLYIASSETMIQSGAMGTRIALLAVIDVLYSCITSRDYNNVKKTLDRTRLIVSRKHSR